MRYANIKKASQDEQQNQTTTTNINYIKKLYFHLKNQNSITKSKQRQKKLKLNKLTCNSPEKIWNETKIRLGNN